MSLKPIFDGGSLRDRPPIHLLFSLDRGLRDGDWKVVSFRGQTWELYNMRDDRTELRDLAGSQPERLQRMVKQWTEMTRDVLHASARFYAPVKPAELPHRHPEWTRFDVGLQDIGARNRRPAKPIRARKNTKLEVRDGKLLFQFTGEDPGIAIDLRRRALPNGPYRLSFRLLGGSRGGGEMFYTTDPKTILPRGERVEFDVRADGTWQSIVLDLPTQRRIHQLRLDVSAGPGRATIADLVLTDQEGHQILRWPQSESNK